MSGWESFFVGELGASAALTGLIFVGISINLGKITKSSYLPNRALEALAILVGVLFLASLLLIPDQSFLAIGIEVLLVGLCEWIIIVFLQMNTLRQMQVEYRLQFITSVMLVYQLATLSMIVAGIVFLTGGTTGFYWIVAATLVSFLAAFVDTWVLVIEINR